MGLTTPGSERFGREALVVARLHHKKSIGPVYSVDADGDLLFF
ncbi:hypothetical protein [Fuerstiella marisgermanici]|nr:hypothetical protein [Fuerstiella marisgermanici]